jgi:RNA polymerase sigma factor (sigma-70 family)
VAARSGDEGAAGELYRRTVRRARAAARCFCADADADDAVADGLSRALTRLHQLSDPAAVEAWMIRCAVRAAVDLSRQRRRQSPTGSIDALRQRVLPPVESAADAALTVLDQRVVALVLRDLPPDDRLLLQLRYHAGFSVRRIAETLGRPGGTVRRQCVEARTMVGQRYLGQQLQPPAGPCVGITDLMCRAVYRRLSDHSRGRIEQHLHRCRACRDRRRELADLLAEMGRRWAGEAPSIFGGTDVPSAVANRWLA